MIVVLIAVLIMVFCVFKARREQDAKAALPRKGCAACRGDRGGEVVLLPVDTKLCPEHWQRRRRIDVLEARLLP